jgi:hypothetical protein
MRSGWRKLTFWRRSIDEGLALVDECEAFLNGRYLFEIARQPKRAPLWVWLNTLAHGERADIEALAETAVGLTDEMAPLNTSLASCWRPPISLARTCKCCNENWWSRSSSVAARAIPPGLRKCCAPTC